MKKRKTLFQGSIFLITGVVIFGILYLSGNGWTSGNTSPTKVQSKLELGAISPVKVENKVESLEVISVEKINQRIQLLFRNNSNKVIKAFVLQENRGPKSFVQLSDENNVMPGGIHTEIFSMPPSEKQQIVSILTVFYEDNTGQGDPTVLQELSDMRLGEQMQNERIYSYFKKFSTTPSNKLLPLLASTKEAIKNLPDDKDASEFVKIGLHNAKENALLDLDRLEVEIREKGEIEAKHHVNYLNTTYQKKALKK